MANKRSSVREVTILIHGVWSRGGGLTKLKEQLYEDPSFPVKKHRIKVYDHGSTWPTDTWKSGSRKKIADAIGGYYHKQVRKYPNLVRVNIVAHSYATWGITKYLESVEHDECELLNTLITVGSVAPKNFDWDFVMHDKENVSQVINLVSKWDIVPMLAPLMCLGMSGDFLLSYLTMQQPGFINGGENVINQIVDGGHSWYKKDSGAELIRSILVESCLFTGPHITLDTL